MDLADPPQDPLFDIRDGNCMEQLKIEFHRIAVHVRRLSERIKPLPSNVLCPVIIFVCSLAMPIRLGWNLVAFWDSLLPPFDPQICIEMDLSLWDFHVLGGRSFASPTQFLYHAMIYVCNLVLPVGVANTIVFWLLFFMCGISMYVFVIETLKLDRKEKALTALIASLAYMFNPYWVFQLDTSFLLLFILAFLPLLMLISRAALISFDTSIRNVVAYSILASVITVLMTPGLGFFEEGLVTAFLVGAYLTLLAIQRRELKSLILTLTLIFTFSLLANLWWIAPQFSHSTVMSATGRSPDYLEYIIGGLRDRRPHMSYFNVLRGMSYYIHPDPYVQPPEVEIYGSPLFIAISILTSLIASAPLLSRRVLNASEALVFAVVAVIFIPLFLTGLNPPFDFLVLWLVYNVPLYIFARSSSLMFILEFVYAYMLGLGIASIYGFMRKFKKIKLTCYSIVLLLLVLTIGVLPFPEWLGYTTQTYLLNEEGRRQPVSLRVQLPAYVRNLVDYLNYSPEEGGVLILPRGLSVRAYDWGHGYFGYDAYYVSLRRPVLTHYMTATIQDDIYDLINDYIATLDGRWAKFELGAPRNVSVIINRGMFELTASRSRWYSWSQMGIWNKNKLHMFNNTVVEIAFEVPGSTSARTDPRLSFALSKVTHPRPVNTDDYLAIQVSVLDSTIQYQIVMYVNGSRTASTDWIKISTTAPKFRIIFRETNSGRHSHFLIDTGSGFSEISGSPWVLDSTFNDAYVSYEIDTNDPTPRTLRSGLTVTYPQDVELPADAFTTHRQENHGVDELAKLLALLNVRYVVVVEDTLGWDGVFQFNIPHIHNFLSKVSNMRLVSRYGKHVLYETTGKFKTFYPVKRTMFLKDTRLQESPMDAIKPLLRYEDPTEVAFVKSSRAVISYERDLPAMISNRAGLSYFYIQVLDAAAPFLLASNILYHDGWVAEIGGRQLEHLKVNGVFNGWIVEETGSFTIKIYYRPQDYFEFLLRLSFAFVAMECMVLLLFFCTFHGARERETLIQLCNKALTKKDQRAEATLLRG